MICSLCEQGHHGSHSMTPCDCQHPDHARRAPIKTHPRQLARRSDPATSHAGALVGVHKKSEVDERIWHALHHMGAIGGTGYDIARETGLTQVQVMRRMALLVRGLWVVDTGRTEPGPNGVPCTVYATTNPERQTRLNANVAAQRPQ